MDGDGAFLCAPINGRSGPVGAHPIGGGTARTLAGSVRSNVIYYTRFDRKAFGGPAMGVYLLIVSAFLSSAASFGLSPHQSTFLRACERFHYPFQVWCRFRRIGGVQRARILSDMPIAIDRHDGEDPGCPRAIGAARPAARSGMIRAARRRKAERGPGDDRHRASSPA